MGKSIYKILLRQDFGVKLMRWASSTERTAATPSPAQLSHGAHKVGAMRYRDEFPMMSDDWHWRVVRLWFNGYSATDRYGVAYRAYFSGKYEQIARTFLSHALQISKKIPHDVQDMLGSALEDDGRPTVQYPSHRKLEFRFRRKGNRVDGIREADILSKMKRAVERYGKVEAALAHLKTAFGISRSEALRVWGQWNSNASLRITLEFVTQTNLMPASTHIENWRQARVDDAKS